MEDNSSLPPALPWGSAPSETEPPASAAEDGDRTNFELEMEPQSLEDVGLKIGDRIEVKWQIEKDGETECKWWGAVVKGRANPEEDSPSPEPAAAAATGDKEAKPAPPASDAAKPTATGTTTEPDCPGTSAAADTSAPAATSSPATGAPGAAAASDVKVSKKRQEPESTTAAAAGPSGGPSAVDVAAAGEAGSLASGPTLGSTGTPDVAVVKAIAGSVASTSAEMDASLDASWDKNTHLQYEIEYDAHDDFGDKELAVVEFTTKKTLLDLEDDHDMLWRKEGDTWDEGDDDEFDVKASVKDVMEGELARMTAKYSLDAAQHRMAAEAMGNFGSNLMAFISAKERAAPEGEAVNMSLADVEDFMRQLKRPKTDQ